MHEKKNTENDKKNEYNDKTKKKCLKAEWAQNTNFLFPGTEEGLIRKKYCLTVGSL